MRFAGDPQREAHARNAMVETAVTLAPEDRAAVAAVIEDHCRIRGWHLHAVNVRSNHVHVVVAIPCHPDKAVREFKAWATRRLKEINPGRRRWWTESGSTRYLWNEDDLESVLHYVQEMQ